MIYKHRKTSKILESQPKFNKPKLSSCVKNYIQYIDYERLKDVLYEFKENAPAEDSVEKSEIERYFQQSSESFFQEIEKELQKVNLFFGEKLNEAARRFTQLKV